MRNRSAKPNQKIVEDVLPVEIVESAVPIALDTLRPWHRPRKQYIREHQWIHFSKQLIQNERDRPGLSSPPEGLPEVRYLTLPGVDYLDVRLLAVLCAELDCCLTSIGFLENEEDTPHAARAKVCEDALIKAGRITRRSQTYKRRFEDITSELSQAYRELCRQGPFHIINIDICGSIAAPTAQHAHRPIDAIYRIIEYQLAKKSGNWLLFVTTDARHDSIASDTLGSLCEVILKNAEESDAFRRELLSLLGEENSDIEEVIQDSSRCPGEKFLKVFSLGLSKWLLHLAREKHWNMKTHSTYCYSTGAKRNQVPTMACLAFEFLPPPSSLTDPSKVTRANPAQESKPSNTAIRAIEKVSDMMDLDQKMKSCNSLRKKMAKNTKKLLKEAGYTNSALRKLDVS